MAAPWPAPIDETERAKIVKLHVEHGLTLDDLRVRMRHGRKLLARVLAEAGVKRSNAPRAYQEITPAVRSFEGQRPYQVAP